jgi:hypothetical protein
VTWPRAEHQIERKAKSSGNEAGPLQDADRAWQITKPHLIGKGEH